MKDLVSVLVPCYNEASYIETCLLSILNTDLPADELEVLVIDGASSDSTLNIVKKLQSSDKRIRLLENPDRITPVALNIGIAEAKGEFVLIASAHASFDSNYISVLRDKLQSLAADAVGGVMITEVVNQSKKALAIKEVLQHPLGVGNSKFRTGVTEDSLVDTVPFGLYRIELLKSIGGYNEALIRNQDIELSKRLSAMGAKIYLIPEVKCHYYARENFRALAINNYGNGKWNMFTLRITNSMTSLSIRHFVPLLFVLSILLPLLAIPFYWPIGLLSLLGIGLYLSFVSLSAIQMKASITLCIMSFIVLHLSYGFGSLLGLFAAIPKSSTKAKFA